MSLIKFLKIVLKNIKIIESEKQGVNQNPANSPGAPGQEAWEGQVKGGGLYWQEMINCGPSLCWVFTHVICSAAQPRGGHCPQVTDAETKAQRG